MLEAIAYSSV